MEWSIGSRRSSSPRSPLGMDFSEGLLRRSRARWRGPYALTGAENIAGLVEVLEVSSPPIATTPFFGLLTDFTDAAVETMPEDESLVSSRAKASRISTRSMQGRRGESLARPPIDFSFHRPRR